LDGPNWPYPVANVVKKTDGAATRKTSTTGDFCDKRRESKLLFPEKATIKENGETRVYPIGAQTDTWTHEPNDFQTCLRSRLPSTPPCWCVQLPVKLHCKLLVIQLGMSSLSMNLKSFARGFHPLSAVRHRRVMRCI